MTHKPFDNVSYTKGENTMQTLNRADYSLDGVTDSIVDLLIESRLNGQDIYLVYCEADPAFTVHLDDGSFIMLDKGKPVAYNNESIERMFKILSAPIHDYK
jgi:hypothetical protein